MHRPNAAFLNNLSIHCDGQFKLLTHWMSSSQREIILISFCVLRIMLLSFCLMSCVFFFLSMHQNAISFFHSVSMWIMLNVDDWHKLSRIIGNWMELAELQQILVLLSLPRFWVAQDLIRTAFSPSYYCHRVCVCLCLFIPNHFCSVVSVYRSSSYESSHKSKRYRHAMKVWRNYWKWFKPKEYVSIYWHLPFWLFLISH